MSGAVMRGAELLEQVAALDPEALILLAAMAQPVAPAEYGLLDERGYNLRDETAKLLSDEEEDA